MQADPESRSTRSFRVRGMDCAEEVETLRRALVGLVGDEDRLSFDLLRARLTVRGPGVTEAAVLEAIARTGLQAEPWSDASPGDSARERLHRRRAALLTLASGLATGAGFTAHAAAAGGLRGALSGTEGGPMPWIARALYLTAIVAGGWLVAPRALAAARRLRPDMHLLMTVAVVGAVAIGEWMEGATVTFLFALSTGLEAWSVGRARRAVRSLMDLAPARARLRLDGGREEDVSVEAVAVGSVVIVRPGERIPLDGRVEHGQSAVDQAAITGESVPVFKQPGSDVFGGTINGDGVLEVVTTRTLDQSAPARIVRLVVDAQAGRSSSEQWVDRFARVYTPVVLVIAALLFLGPTLVAGGDWRTWFYRSLVLLVIACPCALVISTPVSMVAALTAAARNGILVKGGLHLETLAGLRCLALDKTGTLTRGSPAVSAVVPLAGHDEVELLERAASLEQRSDHPIARAIVDHAEARGIVAPPAESVRIVQGKGVGGRVAGTDSWLGSHRYLEETGQETPEVHARVEELAGRGRTVIAVGNDRHVCGLIALEDEVRAEAREALDRLRSLGLAPLVMLTGDNRETAEAIARQAGVDEVHAELLPEDKVRWITGLESEHGSVAMVGDGVNDAPALARSSVGIAMGAMGSDAAIETADVALMSDRLDRLPLLVQHARRTLRIVRQNTGFALGVKLLILVMAGAGFASLWLAIAADMGASLLVILNGLRLLKLRETVPG